METLKHIFKFSTVLADLADLGSAENFCNPIFRDGLLSCFHVKVSTYKIKVSAIF